MAESRPQKPTKWILLVRKNPIGPFAEDEIKEQLAKGNVRINDLAYQIDPTAGPTSVPQEWKFLWQFTEFDRRRKNDPHRPERRRPPNEIEVAARRKNNLPEHLSSLSSKELVMRSRQAWAIETNDSRSLESPVALFPQRSHSRGQRFVWPGLLLVTLLILPAFVTFGSLRARASRQPAPNRSLAASNDQASRIWTPEDQRLRVSQS